MDGRCCDGGAAGVAAGHGGQLLLPSLGVLAVVSLAKLSGSTSTAHDEVSLSRRACACARARARARAR